MNKKQKVFGFIVGYILVWRLCVIPDTYFDYAGLVFFGTIGLFPIIRLKGLMDRGEMDSFMLYCYAPLIVVFLHFDFAFNQIFGTIFYREPPREFLYTTRTQRHFDKSKGFRKSVATIWARRLNVIDPGHINGA